MNERHDTLEQRLEATLAYRADGLHDAPFGLAEVRGRAQSIRRRRRMATAVATVAAVAAIAVPAGLLAGGGTGDDRIEPAPSPAAPGASVLHDGVVTRPDGSTVRVDVDVEDVTELGVLADGRVVVASQRPSAIQVFAPDGSLEQQHAVAANAITMSADDRLVAWLDDGYRVVVLESGQPEPVRLQGIPMPGEASGSVDAVFGSGCAEGGCTVLGGDWQTTGTLVTRTGSEDLRTSEPLRVTDVSPDGDTWAVAFPPTDEGQQYGCVGLYDPQSGEVTARSCATWMLRFSPDGEHLLGGFYENHMAGEVTVLDRELRPVQAFTPADQVIGVAAGWADAGHLLAAVADLDDNRWSLVRVGVDDGQTEVVDGPVPGVSPETASEFLISE